MNEMVCEEPCVRRRELLNINNNREYSENQRDDSASDISSKLNILCKGLS